MKERNAGAIVECPTQGKFSRLPEREFRHDRAMSCDFNINHNVWLALHADDLAADIRLLPAFSSEVLSVFIDGFEVNVFDRRSVVGEPPGHPTIMTDNHIGVTGQRPASDIELSAVQMGLI